MTRAEDKVEQAHVEAELRAIIDNWANQPYVARSIGETFNHALADLQRVTGEDLSRYWLTDQDLRISSFGGKSRPHKYAYGSVHFKTKADSVSRFLQSLRLLKASSDRVSTTSIPTKGADKHIVLLQYIYDHNKEVAEEFDDWAANATQHILWSDASGVTGIDARELKNMIREFVHRRWISDDGPVQRIDDGFLATITDLGLAELEQRAQLVAIKGDVNIVIT